MARVPPPMFRYFKPAAAIPGAMKMLMALMRLRAPRRLPFAFGWLVKRPIDRQAEDSYLRAGMAIDAPHERGRGPPRPVREADTDRMVARGPLLQAGAR